MKTRTVGPHRTAVSIIGLGAMQLSIKGRPPARQAAEVVYAALDAGVNLIDTADVYCLDNRELGHNERLIAGALAGWSGDASDIQVATKGGMTRPEGRWEHDGRPSSLRKACERSLEALAVERIDLYQLHAPDPSIPLEDSVGALAELQREGKIRWIGLSNVSVGEIERARSIVEVVSVQNRLNPFFREALDTGVVQHCERLGIAFIAYSPLGGGRLNKKLPGHPVLESIAGRHGVSAHAVVLAWVLGQGSNVIAIPGSSRVEHAVDSAEAADLSLADEEWQEIADAEFSRA
jgi:aryl-alcohol dehydrogenase-like predicted oxidoreductase